MDFGWAPYLSVFWVFPLLCVLLMAIMMIACRAMPFRFGPCARSGDRKETAGQILDRRYAGGEIGKEQYESMRRALDG